MKISIIVPAYNVQPYIGSTLESLSQQTLRDFEVLIVNDGSTDPTPQTAESYLADMPEARLIHTENGGVSRARNRGLAEAKGEYVLFLDGDDYVDRTLVEKIAEAVISDAAPPDAVVFRFLEVGEDGKVLSDFFRGKSALPHSLSGVDTLKKVFFDRDLRIAISGIAYRRQNLIESGLLYEPDCVNGEDQEFIYRALGRSREVRFVDEPLMFYVQRRSSVTYTYNVRKFDFAAAFDRAAADLREQNDAELNRIADVLGGPYLLEDYLYTIRTCLAAGDFRMSALLRDIELHYPGLPDKMKKRIQECRTEGIALPRALRLFRASPFAYGLLLRAKSSAASRRSARSAAAAMSSNRTGTAGEGNS